MTDLDPDVRDHLRELADVDANRRRLRTQLERLPEQQQLRDVAAEREATQVARDELALQAEAVRDRARKEDRETTVLRQRLAAEQQRMYEGGVTNAREQASMQAEIDATQARIDEHETAELEALEELEDLETRMAAHDETMAGLAQRTAELEVALDESAQRIHAEMAELDVARDDHRVHLPRELVARYDQIDERTHAGAVGELQGARCSACGIELPMVEVDELLTGDPLPPCPNCGRMLLT